jgi:hypothetical protein
LGILEESQWLQNSVAYLRNHSGRTSFTAF